MLPIITIIAFFLITFGFIGTRTAVKKGDAVRAKQYGFLTMFGVSLFIGVLFALAIFHT